MARKVVVIGASAGGVEAISYIASQLPRDFDAAVFVVLHISPSAKSMMPQILSRSGRLPAVHAGTSEPIREGVIYVAPPDKHMLLRDGLVVTTDDAREHGHRPAVDPLFRSAAEAYGERAVGVILTGNLSDGAAGLAAIKAHGGVAIVQDPDEAAHSGMPSTAIEQVDVDAVLQLSLIVPAIIQATSDIDRRASARITQHISDEHGSR
jgi:two-component system, chemotaxis family, protein-glutamate methylesterase/glutaminase